MRFECAAIALPRKPGPSTFPRLMNWFVNLKTRTKLILGFGSIIVLLAVVIGIAYSALVAIQLDYGITASIARLESGMNAQRAVLLAMMAMTERAQQEGQHTILNTVTQESQA